MSARASGRFRDTAMLAMLIPASPMIVPTRPIIPGRSSFSAKSMERESSTSIS